MHGYQEYQLYKFCCNYIGWKNVWYRYWFFLIYELVLFPVTSKQAIYLILKFHFLPLCLKNMSFFTVPKNWNGHKMKGHLQHSSSSHSVVFLFDKQRNISNLRRRKNMSPLVIKPFILLLVLDSSSSLISNLFLIFILLVKYK